MRAIFISGVLGLIAVASSAHDLRGYDQLRLQSPPLKKEALLRRVRRFIDSHWTQHRRGYVTYTMRSRDDEPITGSGYVQPSPDGGCHIRFESRDTASGRLEHTFDAISFRYWGPYMYFHDKSGKNVGAL